MVGLPRLERGTWVKASDHANSVDRRCKNVPARRHGSQEEIRTKLRRESMSCRSQGAAIN